MTQVLLCLGKLGGPISALLPAISSCTQQALVFPGLSTEDDSPQSPSLVSWEMSLGVGHVRVKPTPHF